MKVITTTLIPCGNELNNRSQLIVHTLHVRTSRWHIVRKQMPLLFQVDLKLATEENGPVAEHLVVLGL